MEIVKFHRIYTHADPLGIIRYVGATEKDERARLEEHWMESRNLKNRNHRLNWLRSLEKPPAVDVIEWVRPEDRDERERYWIQLARDYGHKLVNGTDGGDGTRGYVFTEEDRKKIGDSKRGKPHPPGTGEKIAAKLRGQPKTAKHCAALSESHKGYKPTRDEVIKANEAKRGAKRKNASSEYYGVFWNKVAEKWCARLRLYNKYHWIGTFETEIDAAKAVDAFVRENNLSLKLLNFT